MVLVCLSLPGHAAKVTAAAEIKGYTDPAISGSATPTQEKTDEGIREVTIHLRVDGVSDGKRAEHMRATGG
jgi:hypothetical protein